MVESSVVVKMVIENSEQPVWKQAWTNWLYEGGRSESTQKTYWANLDLFEAWFQATNHRGFTPDLLTSWDVREFRTWSLDVMHVAPATWDLRRAALSILAVWAKKFGWISTDPMAEIKGAEAVPEAPRWLTDSEFGRLMRYQETNVNAANTAQRRTRAIRDAAMVALMTHACLREGEVAGLLGSDVTAGERKGLVRIRCSVGKGGKQRVVPLSSEALRAVRSWLAVRVAEPNEPLFVGESGAAISTRAIQKRISAMGLACQVADLTPHRLRHTGAKRMVDAGRPLSEVQRILGHSRIDTTIRYVMAGWEDLEDAVESISLGSMRKSARK